MWTSTVGLVNGKYRYLTAETFGYKINSNGQVLKKRQQWTIEPFPENSGPDGSVSSAASVSSQCPLGAGQQQSVAFQQQQQQLDPNDPCILTFNSGGVGSSLISIKSSSNGSSTDQDNCSEEHENVAIKSHLNKYLAVDSFGNVTCDSSEKSESARFTITICSMSQGRSKDEHIFWAFRNVERGYYLGTTEDGMICCNAKMPKSRAELWHLHLIPARGASFFALKSLGRKRYARVVSDDNNVSSKFEISRQINAAGGQQQNLIQVQLDATISWGPETLFQFKYYDGGRYSLLTSDCRYLTNEGKCIEWKTQEESDLPPPECLFTLEYHSGFLGFRDSFSHYLAAAGRSSILMSRSVGVSRDELFVFESAPIQVSLKATFNNRWVSIKQGVDLSANQTETTSMFETFQLTYHKQTQNWSIMTHECNFWTVSSNASTISVCKPGDYKALNRGLFKLIWSETDATCSLKYIDLINKQERWISARKSGQLFLGASQQDPVKFIMRFQNRQLLNLRPVDGSGFVGLKAVGTSSCRQLEANKTAPDSIAIEYSELPPGCSSVPANGSCNVFGVQLSPASDGSKLHRGQAPEVGPKPVKINNVDQQTINVFNVKLNSTKMGQSVLDRFNGSSSSSNQTKQSDPDDQVTVISQPIENQKEFDYGIDENNNVDDTFDKSTTINGNVESSSTPSVAAIINSFSNTKLSNNNGISSESQQQQVLPGRQQQSIQYNRGSSVSKLASSFEASNVIAPASQFQQQPLINDGLSDTASVITTCSSTASANSSGANGSSSTATAYQVGSSSPSSKLTATQASFDQLAQFECCYLKTISNDRYLVVGDNDSNVTCDATNKACAQPWILELRSHSSIAIRTSDNHAYLQLGTNGTIFLSRCDPKDASLWEF